MNTIFSMDNLFFRTVGKLVDLVWLNILTIVFSLPIFTIGASLTAMYTVTIKMAKNEEGGITRTFFNAFLSNFKNATKVWLVSLGVIVFYALDINLMRQGVLNVLGQFAIIVEVGIAVIVFFFAMLLNYIWPLLARYDSPVGLTVKNSFKLMIAFFPRSICMVIIYLFPFALMLLSDYMIPLWIFYGLSMPAYFCSMLLVKIFEKVEPKKEEVEEAEEYETE